MTDTPLSEHIANIRTAILPYDENDWFQGCSHGGGIYMRDLLPVLAAAERSPDTPLSDDVVRPVAVAIERADNDKHIAEGTINHPEVSSWGEHLARAALEAARYGEMVEALKDARRTMYDEAAISKRIDALLSSIGASQP